MAIRTSTEAIANMNELDIFIDDRPMPNVNVEDELKYAASCFDYNSPQMTIRG